MIAGFPIHLISTLRCTSDGATLLLSQGVPMILSGDECRRTQGGNNNAYCHDTELSWMDWSRLKKFAEVHLIYLKVFAEF